MLVVFAFHSYIHLGCKYGFLDEFVWEGGVAMTGFFILSGFALQISNEKVDFTGVECVKRFYIKRLSAIMPLYLFVHILNLFRHNTEPMINKLLLFPIQTLGLQSHFSTLFNFSHNGGTWFVSCLLACYFIFPLTHILIEKFSTKQNVILILIITFILLWSPFVQMRFHTNNIYENPFFRFLEFSIGMALFNLWKISSTKRLFVRIFNWPLLIATFMMLIVSITIAYRIGIPGYYMLYSWSALPCFAIMILCLSNIRFTRLKSFKAVVYASNLAYSFFLAQCIGLWAISKFIFSEMNINDNTSKILISFILCLCLSVLLHELIEKPVSKCLKQKFLK